jgi:hypothetical protein
MADLAKADVDVALAGGDRYFSLGPLTLTLPVVSFGDGVLTYPANGVPLPLDAPYFFGLNKGVKVIQPVFVAGYMAVYDPDHNTIRLYVGKGGADPAAMVELGHVAVPALVIPLMVLGE